MIQDSRPVAIQSIGNGKFLFNYNVEEKKDETGKGYYECDSILVKNVDRHCIIDAIISERYSKSDEFALINNKIDGDRESESEYEEYSRYRRRVKDIVSLSLSEQI